MQTCSIGITAVEMRYPTKSGRIRRGRTYAPQLSRKSPPSSQPATAALVRLRSSDKDMVLEPVSTDVENTAHRQESDQEISAPAQVPLPAYLQQVCWWAYLHPAAVRVFERQWLVNLILWGNFAQLRDVAWTKWAPPSTATSHGSPVSRRFHRTAGPNG